MRWSEQDISDLVAGVSAGALLVADFYLERVDQRRRLFALRERHCRRLQQRSPFQAPCAPEPLPSVSAEEITPELFIERTDRLRRPLVIRGFMRDARSTRTWSRDHFMHLCGGSSYNVIADATAEDPVTKQTAFETITVRDLIESIRAKTGYRYLTGVTRIFLDHPSLIDDLELGRLRQLLLGPAEDDPFDALNLFIGGPGTGSNMHCAFASNFFNNIVGRKRWLLLEPRYGKYMMPIPTRPFLYSDVYFDPGRGERGDFSRRLPAYEVVLDPGDVLFNAPWWWHRVENLDDFNVGCAVRSNNLAGDIRNHLLFTLMCEEYKLLAFKGIHQLKRAFTGERRPFRDILLRQLDKAQRHRRQ